MLFRSPVIIFLPLFIGVLVGIPTGFLLKIKHNKTITLVIMVLMIVITSGIGYICNTYLMPSPVLNFMLMGMSFSAAFSNIITEERLLEIMSDFNPILGIWRIFGGGNFGKTHDLFANALDFFAFPHSGGDGIQPPMNEHAEATFTIPLIHGRKFLLQNIRESAAR